MILDPLGDGKSSVSLIQHLGNDQSIVMAARVSLAEDQKEFSDERDAKLIKYLLKHKHGCYDCETEVLTKRGWVFWPDVVGTDELLAVNLETKESRFETPERLVNFRYTGPMYQARSQALNMLVTPNHRMVVCQRTDSGRKITGYRFEEAGSIKGKPRIYLSTSRLTDRTEVQNPWSLPSVAFARLAGFFIGDGTVKGTGQNGLIFHIKKPRKISFLKNLALELGVEIIERAKNSFVIKLPGSKKWFLDHFYTPKGEKKLPGAYLSATDEEVTALLDGLKNSDGSLKRLEWVYSTTSEELVGNLQALAAMNGFVFMVSKTVKPSPDHKDCYRLVFSHRVTPRMETSQSGRSRTGSESWLDYDGLVYCATVSTGALVVRRKGKVVVSGNSPFEHNQITFRIKCPIYVDRHLVRHRVGVSKNETSARYVEIEDEFYIPAQFRRQSASNRQASTDDFVVFSEGEPELLLELYENTFGWYKYLLKQGVCREQARGILPLSTYTTSYYTFNLRSLLHLIELRDHEGAQWETRQYAIAMKQLVTPLFPVAMQAWEDLNAGH